MRKEEVYIVGISPYSFRAGAISRVVGVKMIIPDNGADRLCYVVEHTDGVRDYIPVSEVPSNYLLATLLEILEQLAKSYK